MCAAGAEVIRRTSTLQDITAFALQVLVAVSVELGDDLGRGFVSQHGTIEGVRNAQNIVSFENAHGLWVEPAWQSFFEQTHSFLLFSLTWPHVVTAMNAIYVLGHIFVTLGVALWTYVYRRRFFALLRNTVIITNVFALLIYESFPVAPPRMTTHLFFHGHPFVFQDTIHGLVTAGSRAVGASAAYNEFSAMPSIHMAWALIAATALIVLARSFPVKLFAVVYPCLMLLAIVVTGNHYLLDAAGAALVVLAALPFALAIEVVRGRLTPPWRTRSTSLV